MRKLERLLLLAALVTGLLVAWRARRSAVGPAAPGRATTAAGRAAGRGPARGPSKASGLTAGSRDELRSATLTGRVVRADTGDPVPGAIVESERWGRRATALADSAGRFRLEGLPAGQHRPSAHAEGLFGQAGVSTWLADGEAGRDITIAVHPAASLRGRIELAATSSPCPRGVVALRYGMNGDREATADDAGDVLFPALLPGRYEVRLTCEGHAVNEEAPPVEVGDTALVARFAVHEQLAITGILVDEHGVPESTHASIQARLLETPAEMLDASTFSGEDGRFEMRGIKAGTYEVSADSNGTTLSLRPVVVTVAEGAPAPEVRLVAGARHRLQGIVVDERGRPVAGATVDAEQSEKGGWMIQLGDDGRFELEGAAPGMVRLTIEMGGVRLPILSGEREPAVPAAQPITLVVKPLAGRIEGRVLRDGPVRGPVMVDLDGGGRANDRVRTEDDGSFSANVQPDREYVVSATTERGESAFVEHVKTGAHVDLHLRAASTLRGTMRGAPRAFRVTLSPGWTSEVFFATSGAWEIRGVPAVRTTVDVRAPGLVAEAEITLAPGETRTLDLQLAPPPEEPQEGNTTGLGGAPAAP